MASKSQKFDFPIVPKKPEKPRVKIIPKRDVFPNDIKSITASKTESIKAILQKTEKPDRAKKLQFAKLLALPKPFTLKKSAGYRSILPFLAFALLLAMLMQTVGYLNSAKSASGLVLGAATSAYDDLDAANKSLEGRDFGAARTQFTAAQQNLENAQNALDRFRALTLLAPQARRADNVLIGASFLAEAGKNLSSAMQLFDELSVNSEGIATINFPQKLEENRNLLKSTLLLLAYAQEKFDSTGNLPGEYATTLAQAKSQVALLSGVLADLVGLEDLFLSFFGTVPKTYLLTFQNYDEMRGTGGFIGTYGVLKYDNGKIAKLKIESVYNLDGSLTKQIAAPGPFQPDIKKWGLRDSNWFADFPASAKKMLSFFEMESETADGVTAFTPKVFADILGLVGPVDMPAYGVTLTPENFQEVVQIQTSVVFDKKLNQPKKFLDDFAPILLDRMSGLDKEQWFSMFQILKDNFLEKHILLYSHDSDTQAKIATLGYDGKIISTDRDYLSVINSNHGGTKSDLEVRQKIHIKTEVDSQGQVTNILRIKRENSSSEINRNFMRVLVPLGSKLVSAQGFFDQPQFSSSAVGMQTDADLEEWDKSQEAFGIHIRTEANKTEFTGWLETPGLTTDEVVVIYVLPFKIKPGVFSQTENYSLVYQKQPGNLETGITGEWIFNNLITIWSTANTSKASSKVEFSGSLKTDEYWAVVVGK